MARFVLHPHLYTSGCTQTVNPDIVTLADWQQAYRDGASPAALLGALRDKLAGGGPDPAILRTVDAVVCRCNANTGWLKFSSSRRCLISAAVNSRTGGGLIASNSRIVTLPIAPTP